MIVNLDAIKDRSEIKKVLTKARKVAIRFETEYSPMIGFYKPNGINVLRYYTDPDFLLARICEVAGIPKSEVRVRKNKTTARPIAWVILASFGHTNQEVCRAMGVSYKTAGMTQYYRDKLKRHMKTNPASVFLYESIMKTLEKDIELFENELD